jgi:hypothetical protein
MARAQGGQTYANHAHRPVSFAVTFLPATVAFVMFASSAVRAGFDAPSVALLLLSLAVLMAVLLIRSYALALQNRIIKAEMTARLASLGRRLDTPGLSLQQVIALRFASDAELPALMDRAIAEPMTPDQIKRAVTDWQGDYLRT